MYILETFVVIKDSVVFVVLYVVFFALVSS